MLDQERLASVRIWLREENFSLDTPGTVCIRRVMEGGEGLSAAQFNDHSNWYNNPQNPGDWKDWKNWSNQ